MKIYLLSAPTVTEYGTYRFRKISIEEAVDIIKSNELVNLEGYRDMPSQTFRELLARVAFHNRLGSEMKDYEKAIIVRLVERLPEGETEPSMVEEIGLLERVE